MITEYRKPTPPSRELTLREMLDDPIVQDVMRRDGVQRWEILELFCQLHQTWRKAA